MMFKSKDGLVNINVTQSVDQTVFPSVDFAIMVIQSSLSKTQSLFRNIANIKSDNFTMMVLNRTPKKGYLKNLVVLDSIDMKFINDISIVYQKSCGGGNSGVNSVAEHGWLFSNRGRVDTSCTEWFTNESKIKNVWNLCVNNPYDESCVQYKSFSHDLGMIMMNLSSAKPGKATFLSNLPITNQMLLFCKIMKVKGYFYTTSNEDAIYRINNYEELSQDENDKTEE